MSLLTLIFALTIHPAVMIEVDTLPDKGYQLQQASDLKNPTWENVKEPIQGTGGKVKIFVPERDDKKFFRVIETEEPFDGFMILHKGTIKGSLMHEGDGLLDQQRFLAERDDDLSVEKVSIDIHAP